MHSTIREPTSVWRHAMAAVALGLFLSFLGGFGTQQALSPMGRLLFWVVLVATGYVLALAAAKLLDDRFAGFAKQLAVTLMSAVPQLFVVGWALVQVRPGRQIGPANLPMLFVTVAAVQAMIVAVIWLLHLSAAPAVSVTVETPQFGGRISPSLRRDLVALEAEDHYVRVHQPAGSTLVLHRFADAMAELASLDGVQVHRGWWVASAAVDGTFVRDGKRWVRMRNGLEIPVSRSHLRPVLDKAWPRLPASAAQ